MNTTTSTDMVCTRIAQRLAQSVGSRRYGLWFERSARLDWEDQDRKLRVAVPNRFVADWIGRHFQQDLRAAASQELGEDVELDVCIEPERFVSQGPADRERRASAAAIPGAMPGAALARVPAVGRPMAVDRPATVLRHKLEDFVVGPSNELAYLAANRLIEDEATASHPLFMHGTCGLGKTHLLQGICRKMLQQRPDAKVHYTTGEQFTNEFLEAVRSNRIEAFRKRIRRLDLLAVDDIHFIANKQATQQEFLHSFDAIEMSGARVVLASDCHPKLIKLFSEALVSRCVRGMVVEIRQPDVATRSKIIRVLAQRRNLVLLDSVVDELAQRCSGSVREIEGTLTKLQALVTLSQDAASCPGPIGHTVLHRLWSTEFESAPHRVVRIDAVLSVVCDQLQVSKQQVLGAGRHQQVVLARSLVAYLGRQMTSMSYPEIAAALGRPNHSTVITAAHRVEKQIQAGEKVRLPGGGEPMLLTEMIERLKRAVWRA